MKLFTTFSLIFLIFFILKTDDLGVLSQDPGAVCDTITTDNQCYPYLNYTNVYINTGYSVELISYFINTSSEQLAIIPSPDCITNATKLLCLYSFKECNEVPPIPFPLPTYPCRSSCDNFVTNCATFLPMIYPDGFSCDTLDYFGNPEYPETSTVYNLTIVGGAPNETIECSNGASQVAVDIKQICPDPLIFIEDDQLNNHGVYFRTIGNCVLPCPIDVYTEKEYHAKRVTEVLLYTISGVCGIYFILTFGVFPNKLSHKMLIICYLGVTSIFLVLSYVVQESDPLFRCSKDPGRYVSGEDHLCKLSGFFFQMGGLGTILFLTLYAFDFFVTIRMKNFSYFIHVSVMMWVFIFLMAIIPINHYESGIGSAGCWIDSSSNMLWQYFCFYIPVYISTALMLFFVAISVKKVFNMIRLFQSSFNDKRILYLNIRSIVFLIVILFNITFSSMFPLYVSYNSEGFKKPVEDYVTCLYTNLGAAQPVTCPPPYFPSFSLRYLNVFTMAINGICGLIGFGIDPLVLLIYRESTRFRWLLTKLHIPFGDNMLYSGNTTDTSSGSGSAGKEATRKESSRKDTSRKSRAISLKNLNASSSPINSDDDAENNAIGDSISPEHNIKNNNNNNNNNDITPGNDNTPNNDNNNDTTPGNSGN